MPTAERAVPTLKRTFCFADLADARALLLAVSGGPDSTALLVLAARWAQRLRRGPGLSRSPLIMGCVRKRRARPPRSNGCRKVSVCAHRTLRWCCRRPQTGIQEEARDARYGLFAEARRRGARHVLTAHTLDDQAETILFRHGARQWDHGLAGMARAISASAQQRDSCSWFGRSCVFPRRARGNARGRRHPAIR